MSFAGIPGMPNPFGKGITVPGVGINVRVDQFFDKAGTLAVLTKMEQRAYSQASLKVKDYARRSIAKRGLAKPRLAVMKKYPGLNLTQISRQPGITPKQKKRVVDRIQEIKMRPPSAPGTPPHTHVPYGHMLGFRRNLYNAYDRGMRAAVIGPSQKGAQWGIPHLHEFGGSQTLHLWMFHSQYPLTSKGPVVKWLGSGSSPKQPQNWTMMGLTRQGKYPKRPFMKPALERAVRDGSIRRAFADAGLMYFKGRVRTGYA